MWQSPILLITDPNLGKAAYERVSCACTDLTWFSWDVNQPEERADILARIAGGRWELAISFYSDLILPPAALRAIGLPLNIHPALPRIRGVGHDLVPLVERHDAVGATLHRMDPVVDTGEIFEVHEVPLPPAATHASLRAFNQSISLAMLDWLCDLLIRSADLAQVELELCARSAIGRHAWGSYYSRKDVAELRTLFETIPLAPPPIGAGLSEFSPR